MDDSRLEDWKSGGEADPPGDPEASAWTEEVQQKTVFVNVLRESVDRRRKGSKIMQAMVAGG